MIEINPSKIETLFFEGREFDLKRDDLLDVHFSGNKARKFHYFLTHEFPKIKRLISHGSAQSNAMYSLSVLAKQKGWEFFYYVDHIPSFLKTAPQGNYAAALANGMTIMIAPFPLTYEEDTLAIPEGGCMKEAAYGIKQLAKEINSYYHDREIEIFLPSGTGTTALFLQQYTDFSVHTTPCVGSKEYLLKQFDTLLPEAKRLPNILTLEKKYHFGKLYREFFEIWVKLKEQTGVSFDLLYDPLGWLTLLAHQSQFQHDILYIHQGGLLGNESMLQRYSRKYHDDFTKHSQRF